VTRNKETGEERRKQSNKREKGKEAEHFRNYCKSNGREIQRKYNKCFGAKI
jgi:hypothetical protein